MPSRVVPGAAAAAAALQAAITIQVFYKRRYAKSKASLVISGTSGHAQTAISQAKAKEKLAGLSSEAEAMEKVPGMQRARGVENAACACTAWHVFFAMRSWRLVS
jgi:hypothetical protein